MPDTVVQVAVTEAHLTFLDDLRDSGVTNMYGAVPYLRAEFSDLSQRDASIVLEYWMKTFTIRHPKGR